EDSLGAATDDTLDHAYWSQSRRMFTTLEEAVRLYPDDPMAWYRLAELRFHGGFVVGSTPRQALDAFERTIALDSTIAAAYFHLIQLALAGSDTASARRYVTTFLGLTAGVPEGEGIGLVASLLDPRRAHSSYALLGNRAGAVFADLALAGAVPPETASAVFARWLHSGAEEPSVVEARWMPRCHRALGAALWWASQRDTASILALVRRDSLAARTASSVPAIQRTRGSYE